MFLVYEFNFIPGYDYVNKNDFALFDSLEKAKEELSYRVRRCKEDLQDEFTYSEMYSNDRHAYFYSGEDEDHSDEYFEIDIVELDLN